MNKDIFKGKWHELKGKVKKQWSNLTDDDVGKIQGKAEELAGILQKKYGFQKEKAETEIDNFITAQEKKEKEKDKF